MIPLAIDAILELGKTLLNRVIPDPVQAAQAQLELAKLAQNGELAQLAADTQLTQGQLDVDKIEAANPNLFVSGWRPFIGWICGVGLGVQFVVAPLIAQWLKVPALDLSTLLTLLSGMLGLAGMRTAEKFKGVA